MFRSSIISFLLVLIFCFTTTIPKENISYLSPQSDLNRLEKISNPDSVVFSAIKMGIFISLGTAILVGFRPFFIKSLTPNYSLFQILISDYIYAFFILGAFKLFQLVYPDNGKKEESHHKPASWWKKVKFIGFAMLFGHLLSTPIHYTALSLNDATSTEIIHKTTPIFLLIAAVLVGQEKFTRKKVKGVLLVILGALLVVAFKEPSVAGSNPILGKLLALLSAMTFVGSDLANKVIMRDGLIKKFDYLLLAYGAGAILLLFIGLALGKSVVPILNGWSFFLVLINVFVWAGKFQAAKWLEASRIRGIVSTSPVATIIIAMFWYWKFPDLITGIGYFISFALFAGGVILLTQQTKEETIHTLSLDQLEEEAYLLTEQAL